MHANAQVIELEAKVQWVFYRDEASRRWIGLCEPLKLCLEADTVSELRENIDEAMNLLLRNLLRDNELERFLRARGWRSMSVLPGTAEDVSFEVPFELIQRNGHDPKRAVHQ